MLSEMKNFFKIGFSKIYFVALFLLILLNVIGAVSENALLLQSSRPLFIPVFLIFFFIKDKTIAVPFILFLICSFLGDSASMFFSNETFIKASSVMYFLSYLCLVGFIFPKFKFEEFNKLITLYFVVIILINIYFLYTIYGILKSIIPDGLEVFLFGTKSLSMILLVFIAFGVYLNSETKMSILFLMMAVSFMFSDVLDYISHYYVYHWSFLMLDRVLHVLGLYLLFRYITEYNKIHKLEVSREDKISARNILV